MRRLAFLVFVLWPALAWGQQAVQLPPCPFYSGSIVCASTPCYLPSSTGQPMKDCGKVSINLSSVTGTLVLTIQGKNAGGNWVTSGTLTETPANYNGTIDIPFDSTRVAITTCTACTGTVAVRGYR